MNSNSMLSTLQRKRQPRWLVQTSISLACSLAASAAFAQAAEPAEAPAAAASSAATSNALPTVTVTARKRSEKLLEVPISILSFSEKDLRASGTTEITDLSTQAGFKFSSAQGSGAQGRSFGVVTFRGLQGETNFPWENSGGIFIDGIFVSGGVSSIGMTDVARVEVLKGPQNAFFGRSTFGGAVNFITKQPSGRLAGTVNATLNNHGSNDIDATIEGPLVEDLVKGRLSFGSRNKAASFHATDGGELGAESTKFVSGTLHFTPTDDLWLRLRGHYQKDEDSTPATALIAATGNTSCTGHNYSGVDRSGNVVSYTPGVGYFCGGLPSLKSVGSGVFDANTAIPSWAYNPYVKNSTNDPFLAKAPSLNHTGMARETKRVSAQLGYSLPYDMDLAVNAGYNEANSVSIYDADRSKMRNYYALQTNLTNDTTVDARLSTNPRKALRGVFGVSYFKSTYQVSQLTGNGEDRTAAGTTSVTPENGSSGNYVNLNSSVPAVYGSVEYDLNPVLTASFETRRQSDRIESVSYAGATINNSTDNWLPRATLRYKPMADVSTYINLAKGVQPLTVNNGYANASVAAKTYINSIFPDIGSFTPQPTLKSIEWGLKQKVNDRLQYSLAIYDQKWKNRLTSQSLFNPASCGTTTGGTTACPLSATGTGITQGNDAHIRGLELSVDSAITAAWTAGGYLDWKKATWDTYNSGGQSVNGSNRALALTGTAVSFAGNEVSRMPNLTMSANSTYRFGLSNGWSSYVRGDLTYVGSQWDTDFNFFKLDAYARLDVRMGFEKGGMSLELFVKNLANDRSWVSVSRVANIALSPLVNFSQQGVLVTAQEERSVGARLRYAF